MQTRTKESKKRLHSLILLIAFTAVLLIVSTYAWFTAQTDVNISNIRGKVEVAEGLEISLDGGTWTQVIDLGDTATVSLTTPPTADNGIIYGPYTADDNDVPSEILPVSTSGETNNDKGTIKMYDGTYSGELLSDVSLCEEGSDNGYFAFDLYLKDTSKAQDGVTENTLQLNSDSWAWVLPSNDPIGEYKGDSSTGLQNTIRVAFAKYGKDGVDPIPASSDLAYVQEVVQDEIANNITAVSIWEPNAKYHTSYTVQRIGLFFTNAMGTNTYLTGTEAAFLTRTINESAVSATDPIKVYDWSETNTYLSTPNTVQTGTADTDLTATDFAPYIDGVKNLTDITTAKNAFTFPVNAITKYRVYVWIEGQDPDCHNNASLGGGIEVNIGLVKGLAEGSVVKANDVEQNGGSSSYTNGTTTEIVQGTD